MLDFNKQQIQSDGIVFHERYRSCVSVKVRCQCSNLENGPTQRTMWGVLAICIEETKQLKEATLNIKPLHSFIYNGWKIWNLGKIYFEIKLFTWDPNKAMAMMNWEKKCIETVGIAFWLVFITHKVGLNISLCWLSWNYFHDKNINARLIPISYFLHQDICMNTSQTKRASDNYYLGVLSQIPSCMYN